MTLPSSVSLVAIAQLICSFHPSFVNISGSLAGQTVGVVVAENLFTLQRVKRDVDQCENEKVGIFPKLDYSSCTVEKTSQSIQLFINNTIDGEVLAN